MATPLTDIARSFLPERYHYYYARSKLGSDPLYGGVAEALKATTAPVLDLGCGIGLLAQTLPHFGVELDYLGVDNDARKIASASAAARRRPLARTRFEIVDLADAFPAHRGSVVILDMLQFLTPPQRSRLFERAAGCLTVGSRLVIRTGLADDSWRSRVTRAGDVFANVMRWMNAPPKTYPTRAGLDAELGALGLSVDCSPLWGRTPFNNWLVVATPSPAATGSGSTVA